MQQPMMSPEGDPAAHVLASASSGGHQFEVVEFADGSLAIRCDGFVPEPYRWGREQVEACMNLYLRLIRR